MKPRIIGKPFSRSKKVITLKNAVEMFSIALRISQARATDFVLENEKEIIEKAERTELINNFKKN